MPSIGPVASLIRPSARSLPDGPENRETPANVWLEGGPATRLNVPQVYDWGFVIAGERLYFATPPQGGNYPIVSLDLSTGKTARVAEIAYSPFAKFSVSPDGRWLAYDQHEQSNSDLMLVENFH